MVSKRSRSEISRISTEMKRLIAVIQAKCIMEGKKPPTSKEITKQIAKNTNAEDLLHDIGFKF